MHMATWKENGIVPDSDDEEDLESQSISSFEDPCDDNQNDLLPGDNELSINRHCGTKGDGNNSTERISQQITTDESKIETTITHIHSHLNAPDSSPISRRPFKFPQYLSDSEDELAPSFPEKRARKEQFQNSGSETGVPRDDISRSYVRLTSPLSSLESSIPDVARSVASLRSITNAEDGRKNPILIGARHTTEDPVPEIDQESVYAANGRSLRRRNPIQLHPYIVEQEKYRRSLKARGMTPMRIQTQDEVRRRPQTEDSQDPDSQDSEPQDMDVEQESQPMDFDWASVPPSSEPRADIIEASSTNNESSLRIDDEVEEDNNEEFPAIDELLRGKQSTIRHRPRSKLKSYSLKKKHAQQPKLQFQSDPKTRSRSMNSIFDVPASPPATSSPFPNPVSTSRRPISRAISISSNEPTPSWLDRDELESPHHADLPTPATSATKPTNATVLPDSDSDGADSFASGPDPAPSSDSSSNESVQIRKISRKIRGVLPASHLRLDQQRKRPMAQPIALREGFSASPAKRQDRRGIALPKAPRINKGSESLNPSAITFLSDESEKSDDQLGNGFIMEKETGIEMGSLPEQSHLGLAIEDDRIDHMLPSRKRKARLSSGKPRKKRRVGSGLSFREGSSITSHQPKITDHVTKDLGSLAPHGQARRFKTNLKQNHVQKSKRRSRINPPRLSILDVTDSISQARRDMPQFVRLAARSARSRKSHGRQSPSKKFIRLANREDTYDAQSTLRDWREGKIKPKDLISTAINKETSKPVLQQVTNNHQTRLPPPIAKAIARLEDPRPGYTPLPRKLVISKSRQRSMNDFVDIDPPITPKAVEHPKSGAPIHVHRRRQIPRNESAIGRPAQLESLELTYSQRYPIDAFKTSKKALDALYRTSVKRHIQPVPLQLSRFLADDDAIRPSIESTEAVDAMDLDVSFVDPMPTAKRPRCKKRPPNRIDTGAAVYRQPSEPLVLDLLTPPQTHAALDQDDRLLSLGKLGTKYPCDFDIFPLQSGIFFHGSTFIGSGLLSKSLKIPEDLESMSRSPTSLRLGDKEFQWGPWKDNVSSEVGVCFDWLLEQLTIPTPTSSDRSPPDVIRVIMSVVEYVQHHLSFTTSHDRADFLSRMLDILQDFLSNFNAIEAPTDQTKVRHSIEVLVRCTVLSMQLLQISKVPSDLPSMTYQLESLLQSAARHCIKLLLSLGLDGIRKLYDDLQYLSIRESGIKSDRYAIQAWVIIIKVLETAKIPRGSFWDVTNSQLIMIDVKSMTDARIMEKMWYSMFSLLPLCEFDEFGVIIPGSRQSAAFDNWSLPQQLLKRIFKLYTLNARQSPSFNDYCRVIVSRCLHLMVEWGWWKCGGIIGNLFDFFASRDLEHLRNEEVYRSPRFLDELTADPALTLEVEDRCFHVFLKIVALAIKRMCLKGDIKGLRNLISRLLPNHDRQYLKEETILHRELASLRNHHDLLCTLYWAAPRDQRPSLSLIQELVIPDRSHNEACLISLRTWTRLASFVLASSPTPEAYEPLLLWHTTIFTKLLNQYLETNSELQRQAEFLTMQGMQSISETDLQSTITLNKRSTMSSLQTAVDSMRYTMNSTTSSEAAKQAFNQEIISAILSPVRCGDFGCDTDLIQDAVTVTLEYIDHIEKYEPYVPPGSHLEENDSQEYGSIDELGNWARQEMIKPLSFAILDGLCGMVRSILEYRLYQSGPPPFMESLIRLWAILTSLVTEDSETGPMAFLVSGPKAVFEHRKKFDRATIYWPLFLGELLKRRGSIQRCDLDSSSFDLTLEWMLAISKPESLSSYSIFLTKQIDPKKLGRQAEVVPTSFSADALFKNFFQFMRDSSKDISRPDLKELQSRYNTMLKELMASMKDQLEKMISLSPTHKKYVAFVQRIITLLRSEVSDICPHTDYFVRQSSHYWPPENDPNLYVPGLMAYGQRLSDRPDTTPAQLFYYLYNGWKNAFICGRLTEHRNHVYNGMEGWNLIKFMLEEFVPVILHMGFSRRGAWVFSNTYLPIIARRVHIFLRRRCDVLEALVKILKMSINGISSVYLQHGRGIDGINPHHRGIIAEVCNFWVALLPSMIECARQCHGRHGHLDGVNEMVAVFNDMSEYALRSFDSESEESWSAVSYSITQSVHFQQFKSAISDDVDSSWDVNQAGDIRVRGIGPQDARYVTLDFDKIAGATLHDILSARLPAYELRGHYSRRREQIQGAKDIDLLEIVKAQFRQFRGASFMTRPFHPSPKVVLLSANLYRMHAVAFGVLRVAQRPLGRHACQTIASVRYPLPQRHFHLSTNYQAPEKPHISETEIEKVDDVENLNQIPDEGRAGNSVVEKASSTKRARGRPGSGRAKANRLKQPEGLPPVLLPEWFWNNNVKCFGDPDLGGSLAVYGSFSIDTGDKEAKWDDDAKQTAQAITSCQLTPTKDAKYSIHVSVYQEILSALRVGLALKPPLNSNKNPAIRPVTLLQCPKDGGTFYLDSIVETIASKLEADLIRLDAQDIAQIIGPYLDENLAWNMCSTSLLAYASHRAAGKMEEYNKDQRSQDHAETEDDDNVTIKMNNLTDFYKKLSSNIRARADQLRTVSVDLGKGAPAFGVLRHDSDPQTMSRSGQDQWNDLKLSKALESLIFAADSKRSSNSPQSKDLVSPHSGNIRPLIIQIQDYKEMAKIPDGFELLRKFRIVVDKHWQLGHSILLVGTTSAEETESALTQSEIQYLQSDIVEAEKRTIFVPPDRREEQDIQFESDEKARIRNINIRHIEDMISKLSEGTENSFLGLNISKDLDNASAYSAGLEDAIWAYPRVHRVALTMLGIDSSPTMMDGPKFFRTLALLAASDEAKFKWGAVELKREDADVDEMLNDLKALSNSEKSVNDKIKQIRKTGTAHEKRLLGGVIVPSDIHTTFSDIRAPKETIEALKTLTNLSFVRPEAFSYGVLATDKIPGLLLYGPPGTGKTLLAKAVAKESGATVLEISGAEVNDMYVGEGEKNVKAIFTLAKKLSPCVVFIDEADAIFASRSSGSDRKHGTHRELINQFLREWDGMNDMSAFIMVATNRPFDLDEAVLRRLPRRLLVDLPVEKDREAILKIHLKDEVLDESVSLTQLAKDTPFYSGSDLKNISVAAALACVREENEAASKHTGEEPYVYPVRRILTKQHFTKAISEISASISEDMSTLVAIRKFDEKYGDQKGRRRKNSALGFGGTTEPEKDSEAGRVRKSMLY